MKEYKKFNYWFIRRSENEFDVLSKANNMEVVGWVIDNYTHSDFTSDDIHNDVVATDVETEFELYRGRMEYAVGKKIMLSKTTIDAIDLSDKYKQLILGCFMIRAQRAGKDPEDAIAIGKKAITWLDSTDFFIAPASTRFHESFSSGLLYHTLNVYNQIVDLHRLAKFSNVTYDSACLVALVHDWCKINLYTPYQRNVKNNETGKWESVIAYNRGNTEFPHGQQSLELARCFFKFDTAEKLAITHHMGHWYTHPAEENSLQAANERYPLVLMLQFADSLAITSY